MNPQAPTPQAVVEGRYLLDAVLDGWGYGQAWQARDKNFRNRAVVVKLFNAAAGELPETVAQALRAQRSLKHPNVLPAINQGLHEGRVWATFDPYDAQGLAAFVDEQRRTRGQVERGVAQAIFDKVLAGVSAAHEAATPVMHGCLQPACVLLKKGAVDELKVTDFGVAPMVEADALGPFRAPELAGGAAPGIAADVFSLGVFLAELLLPQNVGSQRRALEGLLAAVARDGGAQAGRMQRDDVPGAVWDVVARATKRDPASRWDDVPSMRAALSAAWAASVGPGAIHRKPTGAMAPPEPAPFAGMLPPVSGPLPPVASPMPPVLAPFQAPYAPQRAPTVAPSNAGSPWDAAALSAPASTPGAWDSMRPAGQSAARSAMASAWDPAPPSFAAPPAQPPATWDGIPTNKGWDPPPSVIPPVPAPGASASNDDDWEAETRAAHGSDPMLAHFASIPRESTMALDVDSLVAEAARRAPARAPSAPPGDDDWKDSVVVLDTATQSPPRRSAFVVDDEDFDVPAPGSSTRLVAPPGEVLETMATLRPLRRPAGVEAFIPKAPAREAHPSLPEDQGSTMVSRALKVPSARPATMPPMRNAPLAQGFAPQPTADHDAAAQPPMVERTMMLSSPHEAAMQQANMSATVPAPMAMSPQAPRPSAPVYGAAPAQTPSFQAPPKPRSKAGLVAGVVVVLVLVVVAALVLTKTV